MTVKDTQKERDGELERVPPVNHKMDKGSKLAQAPSMLPMCGFLLWRQRELSFYFAFASNEQRTLR